MQGQIDALARHVAIAVEHDERVVVIIAADFEMPSCGASTRKCVLHIIGCTHYTCRSDRKKAIRIDTMGNHLKRREAKAINVRGQLPHLRERGLDRKSVV